MCIRDRAIKVADANCHALDTDVLKSDAISTIKGPIINEEASTSAIEDPITRKIFTGNSR